MYQIYTTDQANSLAERFLSEKSLLWETISGNRDEPDPDAEVKEWRRRFLCVMEEIDVVAPVERYPFDYANWFEEGLTPEDAMDRCLALMARLEPRPTDRLWTNLVERKKREG